LNNLPTNFNVDAYQHLSFAFTFYDAVRHHRELPLWNPYFGGGLPWAGYIYNLGLSPWALIYALAGEIAGVKIALLLSLALGGIAIYGVARKVALLSPGFSLFAALLFLSSNWMPGRVQGGNYNEFSTYFWLFAVLCFHELLRGRLLGLLFPLYFVIALNPAKYTAVTVLLAGLVIVLCSPAYKDERRFAVLIWLAGALIGFLLAMPKILPMIEMFRLNLVDVHALRALEGYTPQEILTRLLKTRIGGHDSFGVGWLGLGLAAVGILLRFREARAWIVLGFFSFVLALGAGAPFPIPEILSHTPIFSTMGEYGKYFNIYILTAVCMLAAFGLEGLYKRLQKGLQTRFTEHSSGILIPAVFVVISMLAVAPPLIPTFNALSSAFAKPQSSYTRGQFYQISYRRLIGTIRKGRKSLRDDDQYNNVRRNIGTITWNGNIVLPENPVPKFIIDSKGEHLNPDYVGEAASISEHTNSGTIKKFILGFNNIKLLYTASVPQKILLNFNFDRGWRSNVGEVEEHQGLLSLNVGPAEEKEVVLTFKDPNFTVGCHIALAALGLWALFVLWVFRRKGNLRSPDAGHLNADCALDPCAILERGGGPRHQASRSVLIGRGRLVLPRSPQGSKLSTPTEQPQAASLAALLG
jgi:hypothetical protein